MADACGQTIPAVQPQAKAGIRKDTRPAREILSAAQMSRIQTLAAADFETLGFDA